MKKIMISMVCLMITGIQCLNAENTKIILQHNGAVSLYSAYQTAEVLKDAVDGDTIYFNEGNFAGDITISKKLTLIGAGDQKSIISGGVTIRIGEGGETLTTRLMEGLKITGTITIGKSIKGLQIRKCVFDSIEFTASIEDGKIDRCLCMGNFYLSENVKSLIVNNSAINKVQLNSPSAESVVFSNCNILSNDYCQVTYLNCIIGRFGSGSKYATTTYINCLCNGNGYTISDNSGCWNYGTTILRNDYSCILTSNELLEKGYIGIDGKVVGYNGGETPYTLTVNSPKITDFSSSVDPETRKVTINLKVTNE